MNELKVARGGQQIVEEKEVTSIASHISEINPQRLVKLLVALLMTVKPFETYGMTGFSLWPVQLYLGHSTVVNEPLQYLCSAMRISYT